MTEQAVVRGGERQGPLQTIEGTLKSNTLNNMIRSAVLRSYPELDIKGLDKTKILEAVAATHGWAAVFSLGQLVKNLGDHPVIHALTTSPTPEVLYERWARLERFGHSRNRTELLSCKREAQRASLKVRHVAVDGGSIASVNDIFMWGLLLGLLEKVGLSDVEASLAQESGKAFALVRAGEPVVSGALPAATNTLLLRGLCLEHSDLAAHASPQQKKEAIRLRLEERLRKDLLGNWTLNAAAKQLGLSSRSLQRALQETGSSFSDTIQRCRVDEAHNLLVRTQLSISEIAFCVGFSDQSHFTRSFKRFCDVPPAAFRDILPKATLASNQNRGRAQ